MQQADTSNMTLDAQVIKDNLPDNWPSDWVPNTDFINALDSAASSKKLKDFYQVGLWSYCEGDKNKNDNTETITWCSPRKFQFHFDPIAVWELQNTSVQEMLGDKFDSGMNAYAKAAGFMNWAFVITLVLTAVEFVVGFFAIFSRWGSLVTTVISTVSLILYPPFLHSLSLQDDIANNTHHRRNPSSPSPPPPPQPPSTAP